jgi:hypothetical protein
MFANLFINICKELNDVKFDKRINLGIRFNQ